MKENENENENDCKVQEAKRFVRLKVHQDGVKWADPLEWQTVTTAYVR